MTSRTTELARSRRRVAAAREAAALGQGGLFEDSVNQLADGPPRRVSSPPCTSRQAFEIVTGSGIRTNQKLQLLEWLQGQTEPLTSAEIAAKSGMERHGVARRLPDAERDQLVRRCGIRRCRETGYMAITWKVITA